MIDKMINRIMGNVILMFLAVFLVAGILVVLIFSVGFSSTQNALNSRAQKFADSREETLITWDRNAYGFFIETDANTYKCVSELAEICVVWDGE